MRVKRNGVLPRKRWTHGVELRWRIWRKLSSFRGGSPLEDLENAQKFTRLPREAARNQGAASTGLSPDKSGLHARGSSSVSPRFLPVPESSPLSVQLPSSPPLSVQLPPTAPTLAVRLALHPRPRSWILGQMIMFLMVRYTNSASSGGIAGRIRQWFRGRGRLWRARMTESAS